MHNPVRLANAATIVSLGLYVVCRVVSLVAPEFLFNIAQSWFHTFSTELTRVPAPFDIGTFIFGGVTLAVVVWATFYAFASIYNNLAKK